MVRPASAPVGSSRGRVGRPGRSVVPPAGVLWPGRPSRAKKARPPAGETDRSTDGPGRPRPGQSRSGGNRSRRVVALMPGGGCLPGGGRTSGVERVRRWSVGSASPVELAGRTRRSNLGSCVGSRVAPRRRGEGGARGGDRPERTAARAQDEVWRRRRQTLAHAPPVRHRSGPPTDCVRVDPAGGHRSPILDGGVARRPSGFPVSVSRSAERWRLGRRWSSGDCLRSASHGRPLTVGISRSAWWAAGSTRWGAVLRLGSWRWWPQDRTRHTGATGDRPHPFVISALPGSGAGGSMNAAAVVRRREPAVRCLNGAALGRECPRAPTGCRCEAGEVHRRRGSRRSATPGRAGCRG